MNVSVNAGKADDEKRGLGFQTEAVVAGQQGREAAELARCF